MAVEKVTYGILGTGMIADWLANSRPRLAPARQSRARQPKTLSLVET